MSFRERSTTTQHAFQLTRHELPPTLSLPGSALLSCSQGSWGNRSRKTWSSVGRSLCQCGTLTREGECPAAKAPWCEKRIRDSVNFASSDDEDDTSSIPAGSRLFPSLCPASLPTGPSLRLLLQLPLSRWFFRSDPTDRKNQQTAALCQSSASYRTSQPEPRPFPRF